MLHETCTVPAYVIISKLWISFIFNSLRQLNIQKAFWSWGMRMKIREWNHIGEDGVSPLVNMRNENGVSPYRCIWGMVGMEECWPSDVCLHLHRNVSRQHGQKKSLLRYHCHQRHHHHHLVHHHHHDADQAQYQDDDQQEEDQHLLLILALGGESSFNALAGLHESLTINIILMNMMSMMTIVVKMTMTMMKIMMMMRTWRLATSLG